METTIKKPILASSFTEEDLNNCTKTMLDAMLAATFEDENGKTQPQFALDIMLTCVVGYTRALMKPEYRGADDRTIFDNIYEHAKLLFNDTYLDEDEFIADSTAELLSHEA